MRNRIVLLAAAVGVIGVAPVVAHEAFWFAWSQFHPETLVWTTSP